MDSEYEQFKHIADIISSRNSNQNEKLDPEFIQRDLASKNILESIGVDVQKFLAKNHSSPNNKNCQKINNGQENISGFFDIQENVNINNKISSQLPNPLLMPKMLPKNKISGPIIKLENHNTKEILKKMDGLDRKVKPEATDFQKQIFQQNHEARMNRIAQQQEMLFKKVDFDEDDIQEMVYDQDMKLESMSSDEDEFKNKKVFQNNDVQSNDRDRLILLPVNQASQSSFSINQNKKAMQWLEDEQLVNTLIQNLNREQKDYQLLDIDQNNNNDDIYNDNDFSEALILIDQKENKIYEKQPKQQLFEIECSSDESDEENEKYRQPMSWMPESSLPQKEKEEIKSNQISEVIMNKGFENDPFRITNKKDDQQQFEAKAMERKAKEERNWWDLSYDVNNIVQDDVYDNDKNESSSVEDYVDQQSEYI